MASVVVTAIAGTRTPNGSEAPNAEAARAGLPAARAPASAVAAAPTENAGVSWIETGCD